MTILMEDIGKKFGKEWIFRSFSYTFQTGKKYAITGSNGSGKSTLLKIILGTVNPSEGNIKYSLNKNTNQVITNDSLFQYVSYVDPYVKLLEELNLKEFFNFFKKFSQIKISFINFASELGFFNSQQKLLKDFSSGMKQKLKLGLALYTSNPIVLLDEPCTNLDKSNVKWYLDRFCRLSKMLIICSNQKYEYDFCDSIINIAHYKC